MAPLETPEARALLADAYLRDRKFPEAARTYLAMLPPPKEATAADAPSALKAAVAARMSRDPAMIAEARAYARVLEGDPNKASFDLVTAQADVSGAALSEAVRRLADAPGVDAFSQAMRARLQGGATPAAAGQAAAAPTPPPAGAAAAAPAAGAAASGSR
jgi:hypothetical protein